MPAEWNFRTIDAVNFVFVFIFVHIAPVTPLPDATESIQTIINGCQRRGLQLHHAQVRYITLPFSRANLNSRDFQPLAGED